MASTSLTARTPSTTPFPSSNHALPPSTKLLSLPNLNTQGFALEYPHQIHPHFPLADAGALAARAAWTKNISPPTEAGSINPSSGNFTALVLPLCIPSRLHLVAYVLEFAFLYDSVLEAEVGDGEGKSKSAVGRKRMMGEIMARLRRVDGVCAERVVDRWREMVEVTKRDGGRQFRDLEEYVEFRIVDTGAPFVESMMLFGMDMTLTEDEDVMLKDIVRPCYAALGLANDYFSFDRELAEFRHTHKGSITNAVWLMMHWHGLSIEDAKRRVKKATVEYENEFLIRCEELRRRCVVSAKIERYLQGLAYQGSGNVVWSLDCPRYHGLTTC